MPPYKEEDCFRAGPNIFYTLSYDLDPESPDSWDSSDLFLASNYSKFSVKEDLLEDSSLDEISTTHWRFPLTLHDHSGIHLSLEAINPSSRWDSCNPGYVFVCKEQWSCRNSALKVARGHLVDWNSYLSGDVWGVRIFKDDTCRHCNHNEPIELDSLWGIYGEEAAHKFAREQCTSYT